MPTLVAGATGSLGRQVVRSLAARGEDIRILSRRRDAASAFPDLPGIAAARGDVLEPASLEACLRGVDSVISTVGASLDLYAWRDKLPYSRVDSGGNLALLEAARRAGAKRFTYVSVFGMPGFEQTAYVKAHRAVERALEASGLDYRIVRPTGFFGFLDEVFRMARRGFAPVIGDGSAITNPVDERDLAPVTAAAFDESERVIPVGGPEVHARIDVARLAGAVAGHKVRILHSPPAVWRASSKLLARVQPRLSELFEFAAAVATTDAVAPKRGTRRLEDHFRELAARETARR